jgi:hypothetical protein
MVERMFKKGLVVGIIVLFIGVGVQPAFAVDKPEKEEVEPKDYLFETIIEICDNPEVKELFEGYEHNIFNFDYNGKYIFRQLLFKNPELLFSMIFTKPVITMKYFDETYNQGIELIDIFGEEKAYEILASVEISNPDIFNDLHNIVSNNEELSNRISTLEELNEYNENLCNILTIIVIAKTVKWMAYTLIRNLFPKNTILYNIFHIRGEIALFFFLVVVWLYVLAGCPMPNPY